MLNFKVLFHNQHPKINENRLDAVFLKFEKNRFYKYEFKTTQNQG